MGGSKSHPHEVAGRLNANQIVYLDQGHVYLYGEVIQVVELRDRCWVRPLAIIEAASDRTHNCYQIPQGPDVIWPLAWFFPALDTDWLAVLARLPQSPSYDRATANHRLRQLWEDKERDLSHP